MLTIRNIQEKDVKSFAQALESVCQEGLYLTRDNAPPYESILAFVKSNLKKNYPHLVAILKTDGEQSVIGWCDITGSDKPIYRHTGVLGMGVVKAHRNKGIGNRLLSAALARARKIKLERVELQVFSNNTVALELYKKSGFTVEGVKKKAVKRTSGYDDEIIMARWFPELPGIT